MKEIGIFFNSHWKYLPYALCLAISLWLSNDTYPQYEPFRYGLFVVGLLGVILNNSKIIVTIAVIECLVSIPVVIEKVNKAESKIYVNDISKLKLQIKKTENCERYTKDWSIRECQLRNEPKESHNDKINKQISELKLSVSNIDLLLKTPSLIVFLIFACSLPILSIFATNHTKPVQEVTTNVRELTKEDLVKINNLISQGLKHSEIYKRFGFVTRDSYNYARKKHRVTQDLPNVTQIGVNATQKREVG